MTTDLLEIGDFYATYRFALAVLNASAINFYDEFTAWMSTESLVYSVDGIFTDRFIQIPTGAKYVRITSKSDYIETEVYTNIDNLEIAFNSLGNPNRFYQADAVNCGDSITWYDGNTLAGNQSGGTGGGEMCVGYIQTLARTLVFNSYDNQGASGKSMAVDNYVQISAYDYSAKDLVTIAHGTNDFKLNRSIGTIGSITDTTFDTATFYGAYRTVLNAIKTSNVDCEVFLITPIQRDNSGYTIEYTNSAGHKLIDYVNAIKELGEMYSLKVIDLYGESGINFYNVFSYTIDGLHPNNAGHLKMANSVLREIK
jgi:lysophospholipase L1-like esterase